MESAVPRRRTSGNLREKEPPPSSPLSIPSSTTTTTTNSHDDGSENKDPHDETSAFSKSGQCSRRKRSDARPKRLPGGGALYPIITALFLFLVSILLFWRIPEYLPWSPALQGSQTRDFGIGIALHPEDHIYRSTATIELNWTVTAGFRAPDGVQKRVYLINGEFPGPTVEVRSGDVLRIRVKNEIAEDEGLAIHWHGLNMKGANEMDGAVGFTQSPISRANNFTYEFQIDEYQSGTFWYHSHSQIQRADGLYGGLVVHRPVNPGLQAESEQYNYGDEVLLLIGDWYHRSATEILAWYLSSRSFGNEPVPDSLLINGVGRFNCSMAAPARPLDCSELPPPLLRFTYPKPVRFRIVNTGSLAGFTVRMDHSRLLAVQVDGGNEIDATEADSVGILYPGERVDILAYRITGLEGGNPSFHVEFDQEDFGYPNPSLDPSQSFAIEYASTAHPHSIRHRNSASALSKFNLQTAHSLHQFPTSAHSPQQILLYTTTMKLSQFKNIPKGFMNHTSWSPQSLPLLSLPRSRWDANQLVPWINSSGDEPRWVEIVLNNLNEGGHPFHLHGYDFFVLATHKSERGWGSFNPFITSPEQPDRGPDNLVNPLRKDTVFVPRRGYVVLRFLADNEGLWMFHCHILWHQASGMAMGFQVGGSQSEGFAS